MLRVFIKNLAEHIACPEQRIAHHPVHGSHRGLVCEKIYNGLRKHRTRVKPVLIKCGDGARKCLVDSCVRQRAIAD